MQCNGKPTSRGPRCNTLGTSAKRPRGHTRHPIPFRQYLPHFNPLAKPHFMDRDADSLTNTSPLSHEEIPRRNRRRNQPWVRGFPSRTSSKNQSHIPSGSVVIMVVTWATQHGGEDHRMQQLQSCAILRRNARSKNRPKSRSVSRGTKIQKMYINEKHDLHSSRAMRGETRRCYVKRGVELRI